MAEENTNAEEIQHPDMSEFGWFTRMLVRGAMLDPKLDRKVSGREVLREAVNISPLYLPKVNFVNTPDVRTLWRNFCLSCLRLLYPKQRDAISFDEAAKLYNISRKDLVRIERNMRLATWVCLVFFMVSLFIGLWLNQLRTWLPTLATMILSSVFYWKYSFLLWQIRQRSLDPEVASVRNFMKTPWWLESLK